MLKVDAMCPCVRPHVFFLLRSLITAWCATRLCRAELLWLAQIVTLCGTSHRSADAERRTERAAGVGVRLDRPALGQPSEGLVFILGRCILTC